MRGNGASTTSLQESMNGEEIQARLQLEIARLREKDRNSRVLTQQVRDQYIRIGLVYMRCIEDFFFSSVSPPHAVSVT